MKHLRKEHLLTAVMCAIIILAFSSSAAAGVIYVKWNSPGTGTPPVYNGTSWDTAFHKVQDGINAASSGDEVWVAAGTYTENLTMNDGIALYGGFSGSESSKDQRDWSANQTILDGGGSTAIYAPKSTPLGVQVDGLVVTNAYWALRCRSFALRNCVISNVSYGAYPVGGTGSPV
jgi:hypothetical protein